MAGVGPGDLHALAREFLDACIESLDTIPDFDPTLAGAPTRTFVAGGIVALDCCDQLAVHVGNISERESQYPIATINNVTLVATASRCVPTLDESGVPPPVAEQEEAGRQINADKWALWNHIHNLIENGDLFDQCCSVIWGALAPLQPSGGCGGSTLTITVCFDGYAEVFGT